MLSARDERSHDRFFSLLLFLSFFSRPSLPSSHALASAVAGTVGGKNISPWKRDGERTGESV